MSMLLKLHVAGIRSGLRGLGRVGRRSRKQLGVCISQPPLCALGRRANEASASREGKGEEGHDPYDHSVVQHGLLSVRDLSLISVQEIEGRREGEFWCRRVDCL